ncbi:MAG: helix-turn-helix transcriptional regulator [Bellilinea sp.]
MKPAESKSNRLRQIEALLIGHPDGLTQSELARRLGVHRSTIHRNLPDLDAPIYQDKGRLFIDRKAYLIDVRFSLHEALSIHMAARLLATILDRQNPHAASALRKLSIALDSRAPHISKHLSRSADQIDEDAQWQDPNYLHILETLTYAWAESRKVAIWYRKDETDPIRKFSFSPYYIEPSAIGRSAYVIGLREPPNEMRTFKIERIYRAELLSEPFTIPEDFDPGKLLSNAWGIWFTDEKPIEVVLKFGRRVAQRVGETRWHRTEQVTELEDGGLLWRALIAEPQEMMPWIRGWGADVEVLEPEGLREVMIQESAGICEIYHG